MQQRNLSNGQAEAFARSDADYAADHDADHADGEEVPALEVLNRIIEMAGEENRFVPDGRGRVHLGLGEQGSHVLSIDFSEIAEADRLCGRPVMDEVRRLSLRADTLQTLFYVAVHPDKQIRSPRAAGKLITLRTKEDVEAAVITAVWANLPDFSAEDARQIYEAVGIDEQRENEILIEQEEGGAENDTGGEVGKGEELAGGGGDTPTTGTSS